MLLDSNFQALEEGKVRRRVLVSEPDPLLARARSDGGTEGLAHETRRVQQHFCVG